MRDENVLRDERTIAVENTSYRWAYLVLTFGLLAIVVYRAYARQEASWDLLALIVLGGVVSTSYQAAHKALVDRWVLTAALVALGAAATAAAAILLH